MSTPSIPAKAAPALFGLLAGGATGFLLTETAGAFCTFVLDRTLDAEGTGALLAAFIAVPVLCALVGAAIGMRQAAGRTPRRNGGR
ncbi:hypothetical protein ABZY93_30385 [Streptomyces smyrnaeus]|uniref:hypothetical protein n=1 Tax=Streptomyces smyrnaeus TaxID=1387713 RepID=UPI00339E03EE